MWRRRAKGTRLTQARRHRMLAVSVLPKFNMDVYVYNYGLFVISQPCVDLAILLAILNAPDARQQEVGRMAAAIGLTVSDLKEKVGNQLTSGARNKLTTFCSCRKMSDVFGSPFIIHFVRQRRFWEDPHGAGCPGHGRGLRTRNLPCLLAPGAVMESSSHAHIFSSRGDCLRFRSFS